MKNIAGNDASIFLFRFELVGNGIDFVLNEEIAADLYPDVDEDLKPLVHACSETLLRYQKFTVSNTIMDGHFMNSGGFEVMLSKGLGQYFAADEKERLFQDAKKIADLLASVMDRRTQEIKQGQYRKPAPLEHSMTPAMIKNGLEELGKEKHRADQLQWLGQGRAVRPGLRPLRPQDLPPGVTTSTGYDHRGHCYVFEHKTLGMLGRIVLSQIREQQMLLQPELYHGPDKSDSSTAKKRKVLFEKVIATVQAGLEGN